MVKVCQTVLLVGRKCRVFLDKAKGHAVNDKASSQQKYVAANIKMKKKKELVCDRCW